MKWGAILLWDKNWLQIENLGSPRAQTQADSPQELLRYMVGASNSLRDPDFHKSQ